MIQTVQEKLEAWVLVNQPQAPQPAENRRPTKPTATYEAFTPRPRALHTVGLGLTGPQALGPSGANLTRMRPKLEAYLFLRRAHEALQPIPIIPGTPVDRGYEADDEADHPLAP